jgi:glutamate-ammonia-ligase adenylyltransferase
MAGELGLIPAELAAACADSYRMLRSLQHRQRLNELPSRVAPEEVIEVRRPVQALWRRVFDD